MKINLLLSLGLVLVSALHAHQTASDKKAIDMQKLSGKWHSIYLASSEKKRIENGGDMRFSIDSIEVGEHEVTFNLYFRKDGKCYPYAMVAHKTENNNELKVDYEGENIVYMEEANAESFVIFCTYNFQNGTETKMLELYGRSKIMNENVKGLFKDICKKYGVEKDNVIDMTKEDECYKDK
ncbi:major urinary protein-like [Dromiciops gliroides]|uniref:major urinary protein-like n=1 Tax=Dromiciops gliroides TaxID=33562 RepID=UPI001CC4458B|nr:major urinary protein-like [Dromiciops gliroides]